MKSARQALYASARLVVVWCIPAMLVLGRATPVAADQVPVPIARLTLQQRLLTAPPGLVVQVGPRTTTLGALRAAHRAREAALMRAPTLGGLAHGHNVALSNGLHRVAGASNPGTLQVAPQPFVEPASQYATAPADMRAFCDAAKASACLYIPPGQEVTIMSDYISDWDGMVTQAQCAQEGGSWSGMWDSYFCAFAYPSNVTTHFTPASDFKLTQSASCDTSMFAYKVDPHGAVSISITRPAQIITTTNADVCTVSVTPGG